MALWGGPLEDLQHCNLGNCKPGIHNVLDSVSRRAMDPVQPIGYLLIADFSIRVLPRFNHPLNGQRIVTCQICAIDLLKAAETAFDAGDVTYNPGVF